MLFNYYRLAQKTTPPPSPQTMLDFPLHKRWALQRYNIELGGAVISTF